jgi:pimeloyl-ACP methyl ester carboxylesterase
LECGRLVVAQVRGRRAAGTLRLAVAIVRANAPSGAAPLVMLHGGPAGAGGLRSLLPLAARLPLRQTRDIVVYDIRGAGFSEPALCPDFDDKIESVLNQKSPQQRQNDYASMARACVARLKADGIEPSGFSTATNAEDLIDLRRTLGYAAWDLFGVSYGAGLAQEAMRRDAKAIRSVVLVSPPDEGPVPVALHRTLERVFATCAEQAACRTAFPSIEKDFSALYDELTKKPIEVPLDGAGASTVFLDGDRLVQFVASKLESARGVAQLPLIVHELRAGDRMRAARTLVGDGRAGATRTLGNLVFCRDPSRATSRATSDVRGELPRALRQTWSDNCDLWQEAVTDRAERPFLPKHTPTLVLAGEFDRRTLAGATRQLTSMLTRAYVYEIRGTSHTDGAGIGAEPDGCAASIVVRFLENPERAPDVSCLGMFAPLSFDTTYVDVPNVILVITVNTVGGRVSSAFGGKWQAAFPNTRPVHIDLTVDEAEVTGTFNIGAQTLPVVGRVDGNTIAFQIKTADGDRTITFSGMVNGTQIAFTREVQVRPGGVPGGLGMLGAGGARTFTATRP